MGNETSAPNGVEGGGMPPLPPDHATGGPAGTEGTAAAMAAQYGDGKLHHQHQQAPTNAGSQHGHQQGLAPASALQVQQKKFRDAAKRGVERTKANMEKTRALVKQGTKQKRGSKTSQQLLLAADGAAAGELSENGSSHLQGQIMAPLHHQHSAPMEPYSGGERVVGQKSPHGHYQQHHQQYRQQYQPHHGGYVYQKERAVASATAAQQRPDQYYQQQRSAPPPSQLSSGHGRKVDPRRSPKNTALVDVMYASEAAHPPGVDSFSSIGAGAHAAASQMADTAAAFAASLSSQMGQLSLSASEAAAAAAASASGVGSVFSAGTALSSTQQMQQQEASGSLAQYQQQAAIGQHQHAHQGRPQPPGIDSMGSASGGYKTEGLSNDEDEWKNAWDEDEEESDGGDVDDDEEEENDEEDVLAGLGGPLAVPASQQPIGGGKPPKAGAGAVAAFGSAGPALGAHQPFRPAMDGGHSSSTSASGVAIAMSAGQWVHPSAPGYSGHHSQLPPAPTQQQKQKQQMYYPASGRPSQQQGVAAPPLPPGTAIDAPRSMVPGYSLPSQSQSASRPPVVMAAHETEEDVLKREADRMLSTGNGAIPWDMTATAAQQAAASAASAPIEKPCIEMFFPMLRVLGKGSFGKVVLVQKQTGKERGGLFAMKILRKSHLVKRRQIERTKTERKVLSLVDHPFIMKLHYAFQTDDKLYLVLDYCPGGELFFHLSRFRRFPERVARFFAAELLLALGHLHKRGIIYRDLKPENVLLDADGHVKLGDFGLAKDGIRHPCAGATSMCGTPEYMAPEVLGQQGHGFCVDYWGLGMLTYEMMTGLPPWYTTDRSKLFRRLKSAPLDIPSFFSPQSASFASVLLERDPHRRLGVQGLRSAMSHEFFRDIDWSSLRFRRIEAPIRPCEGWSAPGNGSQQNSATNSVNLNNAAIPGSSSVQNQISQNELDVATANFDPQFTRMAVDTEDAGKGDEGDDNAAGGDGAAEETLNANTFVGFTFDEMDPRSSRGAENARTRGGPPPADPRAYRSRRS
mmetsp:Transcript_56088/g.167865  ORF Transcript_56088/g.167865 Transcript_56088/m.167865 type:complete len:1027 (-) Transcript_56088:226-3306(-)